jgi:hypothetical protein
VWLNAQDQSWQKLGPDDDGGSRFGVVKLQHRQEPFWPQLQMWGRLTQQKRNCQGPLHSRCRSWRQGPGCRRPARARGSTSIDPLGVSRRQIAVGSLDTLHPSFLPISFPSPGFLGCIGSCTGLSHPIPSSSRAHHSSTPSLSQQQRQQQHL